MIAIVVVALIVDVAVLVIGMDVKRRPSGRSFWSRWQIGDVRYEVQSGKHILS